MNTALYTCDEKDAEKIHHWMLSRGGIAIWRSVNLSNPGASWTTPALDSNGLPTNKPTWQADGQPERVITDIADVRVSTAKEVKRFHVATRMGGGGLQIKVTDGGSRKLRAEVAKVKEQYGKDAWYEFDYGDEKNAVILIEDSAISLAEWVAKQSKEARCVQTAN